MEPLRELRSKTIVLPIPNVDTDQIIPARFLTVTTREGLGEKLFADWRTDPAFVLNQPEARGASVLVAGDNFGCGSSREHAPWALVDWGIRAVVSTSIADIFKNNALKNGLVPVEVEPSFHAELLARPGAEVTIDVDACTIALRGGGETVFPIDGFARHCLLHGIDPLEFLLQQEDAIAAYEARSSAT